MEPTDEERIEVIEALLEEADNHLNRAKAHVRAWKKKLEAKS